MFDSATRLYLLIAVVGFFILIIAYSLYISLKIKTYEDYHVAGRNIPVFPLVLSMMGTAIGGSTLLGFTTSGYAMGLGRVWEILPAYIIVIFMILFMLKAIRNIGLRHKMITIPDFTSLRYGEQARLPSTIALLFAYAAITGMQYTAISIFLNVISGLPITAGILVGWLVLTVKAYLGGLKAVIWADTIQGSIQNMGIMVLFAVLFVQVGGFGGAVHKAITIGYPELFTQIIFKNLRRQPGFKGKMSSTVE